MNLSSVVLVIWYGPKYLVSHMHSLIADSSSLNAFTSFIIMLVVPNACSSNFSVSAFCFLIVTMLLSSLNSIIWNRSKNVLTSPSLMPCIFCVYAIGVLGSMSARFLADASKGVGSLWYVNSNVSMFVNFARSSRNFLMSLSTFSTLANSTNTLCLPSSSVPGVASASSTSLYPVSANLSRSFDGACPSTVNASTMMFLSSPILDLNWSTENRLLTTPSRSPAFSPSLRNVIINYLDPLMPRLFHPGSRFHPYRV